jgi:hypothetical protein
MEHNHGGKIIYSVHYHNSKLGKYAKLHLAYPSCFLLLVRFDISIYQQR